MKAIYFEMTKRNQHIRVLYAGNNYNLPIGRTHTVRIWDVNAVYVPAKGVAFCKGTDKSSGEREYYLIDNSRQFTIIGIAENAELGKLRNQKEFECDESKLDALIEDLKAKEKLERPRISESVKELVEKSELDMKVANGIEELLAASSK